MSILGTTKASFWPFWEGSGELVSGIGLGDLIPSETAGAAEDLALAQALLAERSAEDIAARGGAYREPFVGGGALFFAIRPILATLADANERLVRMYRAEIGRAHV
mgnify:CR=1 FL=1